MTDGTSSENPLGKAAAVAGVAIAEMIALFSEYGVRANLRKEDYLEGLANLRRVW